jgi:hypothetical protein
MLISTVQTEQAMNPKGFVGLGPYGQQGDVNHTCGTVYVPQVFLYPFLGHMLTDEVP